MRTLKVYLVCFQGIEDAYHQIECACLDKAVAGRIVKEKNAEIAASKHPQSHSFWRSRVPLNVETR